MHGVPHRGVRGPLKDLKLHSKQENNCHYLKSIDKLMFWGSFAFLCCIILIKNMSYCVSLLLISQITDTEIQKCLGTPAPEHVCLQLSPSPKNVSRGCPATVGATSPWRHPLAVSLIVFSSQFPTVLKHKQVYSAELIAAKVSQEIEKKKKKK